VALEATFSASVGVLTNNIALATKIIYSCTSVRLYFNADYRFYLIIFGDVFFGTDPEEVCVPTYQKVYDVYFTQLTQQGGTYDIYPDLMIGRCSVDDTSQVKNEGKILLTKL